ncbi:hypothetical protein EDD86DRAFT_173192, partial [Gorgonomyces haynaldii]
STEQLQIEDQPISNQSNLDRLCLLFSLSSFFQIILTIVPVLAELPDFTAPYPGWYGLADLIRLLEPIVALPLHLLLFTDMLKYLNPSERLWMTVLFGVSVALYQQGAGFHSASNMFKHSVETLSKNATAAQQYPQLVDIYQWMRDEWEHLISHYMYAVGGILISWIYCFGFRNLESEPLDRSQRIKWLVCSLLYSIIVTAVAVQFISGYVVALVLICVYGFGVVGGFLYWKRDYKGKRVIVHYFLHSYLMSFVLVII